MDNLYLFNIEAVSEIFNLSFDTLDALLATKSIFEVKIFLLISKIEFTNFVVATELSLLVMSGVTDFGSPNNLGENIDLLNNESALYVVVKFPEVGKFKIVGPEVLKVRLPNPLNAKFLSNVIVLPSFTTPVPPFEPGSKLEMVTAESEIFALFAKKA